MRVLAILLSLAVTLNTAGCSWILMRPVPEDYHPSQIPLCGSTSGFVVDTFLAMNFVGVSTYLLHDPPGEVDMGDPIFHAFVFDIVMAGVTLASAITGIIWACRCRRADDSHEAYLKTKVFRDQPVDESEE